VRHALGMALDDARSDAASGGDDTFDDDLSDDDDEVSDTSADASDDEYGDFERELDREDFLPRSAGAVGYVAPPRHRVWSKVTDDHENDARSPSGARFLKSGKGGAGMSRGRSVARVESTVDPGHAARLRRSLDAAAGPAYAALHAGQARAAAKVGHARAAARARLREQADRGGGGGGVSVVRALGDQLARTREYLGAAPSRVGGGGGGPGPGARPSSARPSAAPSSRHVSQPSATRRPARPSSAGPRPDFTLAFNAATPKNMVIGADHHGGHAYTPGFVTPAPRVGAGYGTVEDVQRARRREHAAEEAARLEAALAENDAEREALTTAVKAAKAKATAAHRAAARGASASPAARARAATALGTASPYRASHSPDRVAGLGRGARADATSPEGKRGMQLVRESLGSVLRGGGSPARRY